ncbi:MAG: hypothetical protein ACK5LN_13565 [Propioniciclava sp.]
MSDPTAANFETLHRSLTETIQEVGLELAEGISHVDGQVGQVASDLALTSSELQQLKADFEEFVTQAARTAAVQQSETRVGNLKAELDRQYGHYSVVRRTSVGLLQAFDVGNVSKAVTTQISEELMLQTPRYWLAPALVALAAWANDDEDIAENSIREAYARDRSKTSLLFTIILRRQGRLTAATRWLRHYLDAQDPTHLGREFAVILEATSFNAFGPAAQQLMTQRLATWVTDLRNNDQVVEDQVARWLGEINDCEELLNSDSFPTLASLAPADFPQLQRQLEAASALPVTIEKYTTIATMHADVPAVLEDLLDDLVDRLVTEYDAEELPLRREVLYHETVVSEQGNINLAQQKADHLQQALDDTTDAVSMQTQTAISPAMMGASVQTQRIAIGAGLADFRTAIGRHCAAYRAEAIRELTLVFDEDHSRYAQMFSFEGCVITTDTPEEQGVLTLGRAWQDTMESAITLASFQNSWYTKPALIAGGIALILAFFDPILALAVALIAAGIIWYLGDREKRKCTAAVAAIEQDRDQALAYSISQYRTAVAEHVDALETYRTLDGQEPDLLALVDTWPTSRTEESA